MSGEPRTEPASSTSPALGRAGRVVWAEGDSIRQLRVPAALPLVVLGGVVSGLLVLWITRRYDFYFDEWSYVLHVRNFSIGQYFAPHNEHWITIPLVIYRVLLLIFGGRTYLPYMAVLAAWNLLAALFLFLLIRRRSGEVPGLVAAAMYLTLGRGYENLIEAGQITFVEAAALGLLSILLLTGPRVPAWRGWLGSAALMASLMSSGPSLFFLCWLVIELALGERAWRKLLYLVLPVAGYLVWFALVGRVGVRHESPFAPATLIALLPFVAAGIGSSAAALVGLGSAWAPVGAILLVGIVGLAWGRRRPDWGIIGAAAGLVAEFVLVGLVRVGYGDGDAAAPRYVDIAAIFMLVVLADAVGRIKWRSPIAAAALAVVLIGLLANGLYLHQAAKTHYTQNILPGVVSEQVAWAYRDSPGLNRRGVVDPVWLPAFTVNSYITSREVQGSVLPSLTPNQLTRYYPPLMVDRSLANLFPPRVRVTRAPTGDVCTQETDSGVQVAAGHTVTFESNQGGPVVVQAWHSGPIPATIVTEKTLTSPDQAVTIRTGTPRPGFEWWIRVVGRPYSVVSVCSSP